MLRALCIVVAIALGVLAIANGLVMLASPAGWYSTVPGVTTTGPFNQHFIRDIGLIFLLMGIAFLAGAAKPQGRAILWGVATFWLSVHALLHLWEVAVGISLHASMARDFPAVTLPAILGIMLTFWAAGAGRAPKDAKHGNQRPE